MKKISVFFTAVLLFLAVGVAKAQKFATMDVAAVLSAMPDKKKVDENFESKLLGEYAKVLDENELEMLRELEEEL